MRESRGTALRSVILGLALTLLGLLHQTVVLHTDVVPNLEPYASYFLEARGWPLAWLVTEPSTSKLSLSPAQRLLIGRFLLCWTGATAIAAVLQVAARKSRVQA